MPQSARERQGSSSSSSPVEVLSVPVNVPVTVRFLGPIYGLDTHWRNGRTVPCDGDGDCPSSIHRTTLIWKGYAAVQAWEPGGRVWRPYVLEVTEALEEILRQRELRGEVWTLSRKQDRGKTDPVRGVFNEKLPEGKFSKEFDITPVLQRLFHRIKLNLGKCNPLPPKVMLEAVAGDAPNFAPELVDKSEPRQDPKAVGEIKKAWEKQEEKLTFRDRVRINGSNGEKPKVEESANGR